ncbi:MAG TPA: hypothetical protein VLA49_21955 [Anaerolineales bacterium]|nr:hypothetical protein [Anaerolineales bacterium]
MTVSYACPLTIWPSVLTILLLIMLSRFSGRRCSVPEVFGIPSRS